MAKIKTFLRIAKSKKGYKVSASSKPNFETLRDGMGIYSKPYPTVSFAISFELDDALFKQAERVIAEISLPSEEVKINFPSPPNP